MINFCPIAKLWIVILRDILDDFDVDLYVDDGFGRSNVIGAGDLIEKFPKMCNLYQRVINQQIIITSYFPILILSIVDAIVLKQTKNICDNPPVVQSVLVSTIMLM